MRACYSAQVSLVLARIRLSRRMPPSRHPSAWPISGPVLEEANMSVADIVRLNAYVTAHEHLAAYMQARDVFLGEIDPPPASTLMIVVGFSRPEFLVEVEAVAAAPA